MADMQKDFTGQYPFLRSLDIEQLENLLKTDFSNSLSEDISEEFIDAIVEVILEKEKENPSGRLADVDKAWADFQTYYNVPERDGVQLYPDLTAPTPSATVQSMHSNRPKRLLRCFALVAATIGLFMALLVVAQAAGLDVFGAMARWTDETFSFISAPASNEGATLRAALEEHGIPKEYAPTWVPAGFKAGSPQISSSKRTTELSVTFSNGNQEFVFAITQYASSDAIETISYEKNLGDTILYSNGHQLFYIFDNVESCVAAWSDGQAFTIDISGEIPLDDMKSIIDSIGG